MGRCPPHLLISAIASPRTKLPNSGTKQPSWRAARVQWRRTTVTIIVHRSGCAAFERGGARSAHSFSRHEPDRLVAASADCSDAFALDVLKKGVLFGAIDLPEAEVVLVDGGHFSVPLLALAQKPSASQTPVHFQHDSQARAVTRVTPPQRPPARAQASSRARPPNTLWHTSFATWRSRAALSLSGGSA